MLYMKSLSIEQFEKAKKYEVQFNSAVYGKYLRAQPTHYYNDLCLLCSELSIPIKLNCPQCLLNAVTALGKKYFETKEELEAEAQKTVEEPQQADSADKIEEKKPKIAKKPVVTRSKTNKK